MSDDEKITHLDNIVKLFPDDLPDPPSEVDPIHYPQEGYKAQHVMESLPPPKEPSSSLPFPYARIIETPHGGIIRLQLKHHHHVDIALTLHDAIRLAEGAAAVAMRCLVARERDGT